MELTGAKVILITGLALAGGFLIGFVPQFVHARTLQSQVAELERAGSLSRARDLACMLHLEVLNRNYGHAADLSRDFFDQVGAVAKETSDAPRRDQLQAISAQRETVSDGLAKADPGLETQIRDIVNRLHREHGR